MTVPNPYRDTVSEVPGVCRKDWKVPKPYRDAVSEVSGVCRKDWKVPKPYRDAVSEVSGVCRLLSHRSLPIFPADLGNLGNRVPVRVWHFQSFRQTSETSETASL